MSDQKLFLNFRDISNAIRQFDFPEVDYVVGIATGGIYPAVMIAHQLNVDFGFIHINFRDPSNALRFDEPRVFSDQLRILDKSMRILLVDEASVSGKTIEKAMAKLKDYPVKTFVLKGRGDYVLFPEIQTCVIWPWKLYE